jgi:hypothetical protein
VLAVDAAAKLADRIAAADETEPGRRAEQRALRRIVDAAAAAPMIAATRWW